MKNLWIVLGILVIGFVGIFFLLHKDGSPSEWDRRGEAHAVWKQSAVEPVAASRPEAQDQLRLPEDAVGGTQLRQPASTKKDNR